VKPAAAIRASQALSLMPEGLSWVATQVAQRASSLAPGSALKATSSG